MDSIIQKLKNEGTLKLYHDYRMGHLKDLSGNGYDGTITGLVYPTGLVRDGLLINIPQTASGSTTDIGVSTVAAPLAISSGTFLVIAGRQGILGEASSNTAAFLHRRDRSLEFAYSGVAQKFYLYNGSTLSQSAVSPILGKTGFAVSFNSGSVPVFYVDGVSVGNGDTSQTYVAASSSLGHLFNIYGLASNYSIRTPVKCIVIVSRVLTAQEHAQLYAELQALKIPRATKRVTKSVPTLSGKESNLIASYDLRTRDNKILNVVDGTTGTHAGQVVFSKENFIDSLVYNGGTSSQTDLGVLPAGTLADQVSLSVLVKYTSTTTAAGIFRVAQTGKFGLGITCGGTAGTIRATLIRASVPELGRWSTVDLSSGLNDGRWHHLVLTASTNTTDNATLWIDGVPTVVVWGAAGGYAWSSVAGYLGGGSYGTLACTVADPQAYNKILTQTEVSEIYKRYSKMGVFSSQFGPPVSTAARGGTTGSNLENTGWYFGDTVGRWTVSTGTINGKLVKTLSHDSGFSAPNYGSLYFPVNTSPSVAAYGTWEFWHKHSTAGESYYSIISNLPNYTAGYDDYWFYFAGNVFSFYGAGLLFVSNTLPIVDAWIGVKITRELGGVFTIYHNIGAGWVKTRGTANPFTDNTITTSNYRVLFSGKAGQWSLGDISGNYGMSYKPLPAQDGSYYFMFQTSQQEISWCVALRLGSSIFINWGDGSTETYTSTSRPYKWNYYDNPLLEDITFYYNTLTHSYGTPGTRNIIIRVYDPMDLEGIDFYGTTGLVWITSVPDLSRFKNLLAFSYGYCGYIGTIFDYTKYPWLQYFEIGDNDGIVGVLPSFTSNTELIYFSIGGARVTGYNSGGSIPVSMRMFWAYNCGMSVSVVDQILIDFTTNAENRPNTGTIDLSNTGGGFGGDNASPTPSVLAAAQAALQTAPKNWTIDVA